MRLLTLNLHCRQEVRWRENLEILADFITTNDIDVVALQEVAQPLGSEVLSADNDAQILVSLLLNRGQQFQAHWTLNHIGFDSWYEGVAILSRYPIKTVEEIQLSETAEVTNWQTRKAQIVTLDLETDSVSLCNLHLGIEGQALLELRRLTEVHNLRNTIVVGDFNISDSHPDYDLASSLLGLPDVYQEVVGKSDPTFFPGADGWGGHQGQRIDYVFGHGALSIQRAFTGGQSPRISDHMGLLVDFSV